MTDYNDVGTANRLIAEQQNVQMAISMIDEGGTLSALTIAPPPLPPDTTLYTMMSPIALGITEETVSPDTMAAIRSVLVKRDEDISQQLTDLGVTNQPPARKFNA